MPALPPITKQVRQAIKTVFDVGRISYRVLRVTKQIEFAVVSEDPITGQPQHKITHTVDLTDAEHKHLQDGGKIIIVHACGWQPHVKI